MNRIEIEDALIEMGASRGVLGFGYIVDSLIFLDEKGFDVSFTKELYPEVAKKNKTTSSRVERAIRYVFDKLRSKKEKYESVEKYIGFSNLSNSASLKMLYTIIGRNCAEDTRATDLKREKAEGEDLILRNIFREELDNFFLKLVGDGHEFT